MHRFPLYSVCILITLQISEDPSKNPREVFDIETRTENLVSKLNKGILVEICIFTFEQVAAGEALFKMIADIRHSTILNDFPIMNKEVAYSTAKYKKVTQGSKKELWLIKYLFNIVLHRGFFL